MADWGLGFPLDSEEIAATHVLRTAVETLRSEVRLFVCPPIRFVLAPYASSAFGVDPDTAHATLASVVKGIRETGFSRIVFYNSSPWNEELIDAAARDLRISLGVQCFCINLSGIGMDFLPGRSEDRVDLSNLLTYLLDQEPETTENGQSWTFPFPPGDGRGMAPLQEAPLPPEEARKEGRRIFQTRVLHLERLLREIDERPPLADDGQIPNMTA